MSETHERALTGAVRLCVRRPVGVLMVTTAVVVFGVISYQRLAVELMPPIRYPTMTIRTEYPGSAPAEVEKFVAEPIEEAVGVVGHLESIESRSRAGVCDVRLEFEWGTDMDQILLDIREKLNQVQRELPADAEKPLILRYDPSLDPVLRIAIYREGGRDEDLVQIKYLAEEEVKRELSRIPGVASVEVHGGLEEEIRIDVDKDRAASLGIDLSRIVDRVRNENVNIPAGDIFEGDTRKLVRTLNEFENVAEIEDLVILHQGDAAIRLRDVATVRRTYKEREVVTRVGDRPAILVDVYKEAQANIVDVAGRVRAELEGPPEDGPGARFGRRKKGLAERLGDDVEVVVVSDRSVFIADATREVQVTAVIGGILAVVCLFLFLGRLGPTAIISLSIPLSILATFAPMNLGGLTLNVMSLGGLALGIGMLVDNSIVVLESIHRCREEGDSPFDAAVRGTGEVASAVVASTLTTISVFAPLVFVSGVAGQLFRDQALTVVFSLLASLLVSLTVIPMLSGRDWRLAGAAGAATRLAWLLDFSSLRSLRDGFRDGPTWRRAVLAPYTLVRFAIHLPTELAWKLLAGLAILVLALVAGLSLGGLWLFEKVVWPVMFAFDLAVRGLRRGYTAALAGALDHKWVVVLALAPLVWLARDRYEGLGSELLPPMREGEFHLEIGLAPGTPIDQTDDLVAPLSAELMADPTIDRVYTEVGVEPDDEQAAEKGSHTAVLAVVLRHDALGTENDLIARLRGRLTGRPEVQSVHFSRPTLFSFEDPISVVIYHDDLDVLRRLSAEVVAVLSEIPGLIDVRSSLRRGSPEMLLSYDRESLARYSVATRDVAERVRRNVLGDVPTQLREGDRKVDIRIRVARDEDDETEMVRGLRVTPASGAAKRLDEVARIDRAEGPSEIRRVSHQGAAVVTAGIEGFDLGTMSAVIRERLGELDDTDGADIEVGGQNEEMESSRKSMFFAIGLAIFLVYVVMASQFESLVHPVVILATVPLGGIGVVLALDFLGLPVSVLVYTGSIVLAGVVVNNAIVLVDYVNHLRNNGVERREAIVTASGVRLRPILMTTITTCVGLLPLTGLVPVPMALGQGLELRAPLAITIIAGLSFSTLLTLFVIPVVYDLLDRIDPSSIGKATP